MPEQLASENLARRIVENPYPGRGIVIGKNDRGRWIQVYWIMGRSENSRNRVFVYQNDILRTRAADPSKLADPSLVIYNAMRHTGRRFIVTNGAHTDAVYGGLKKNLPFPQTLLDKRHEPDGPIFTPRISGCLDLSTGGVVWLSIIRSSPFDPEQSEHHFFRYTAVRPGYGYAITTYRSDGDPPPAFEGAPYLLPLRGNASHIADTLWDALNEPNKISLAVREIDPETAEPGLIIRNKHTAA